MRSAFGNRYLKSNKRKPFRLKMQYLFDRREAKNLVLKLELRRISNLADRLIPDAEFWKRTDQMYQSLELKGEIKVGFSYINPD